MDTSYARYMHKEALSQIWAKSWGSQSPFLTSVFSVGFGLYYNCTLNPCCKNDLDLRKPAFMQKCIIELRHLHFKPRKLGSSKEER